MKKKKDEKTPEIDIKIFRKKKKKKRQYSCKRYKNLSEDDKQKLFEHRKSVIK